MITARLLLPTFTTAMALGNLSQAALIAYDPFNQAVGDLDGSRSSGGGAIWTAPNNNWTNDGAKLAKVTSGSLSYGSLATSGNKASLDNRGGELFRSLDVSLGGNGTSLWMSFLIVATADNTGISLFSGGTEHNFMGAGGGSNQNIGLQNPNIDTGIARSGATRFYVINFDMVNDINRIWIDPDMSSLGNGLAPTGGTTGSGARADFTWNSIRLGDFNGSSTASIFDELRIGDTWADVSPVNATTVPEPSALVLSGLGAIALLRRRR